MHGHYLVKGLAGFRAGDVAEVVRETWHDSTSAAGYGAWVVRVEPLRTPAGAIHYLNLHHRKAAQRPPDEWRGMVERGSRGYWSEPIAQLRERAQDELAVEAWVWSGLSVKDARFVVSDRRATKAAEKEESIARKAALRDYLALAAAEARRHRNAAVLSRVEQLQLACEPTGISGRQ